MKQIPESNEPYEFNPEPAGIKGARSHHSPSSEPPAINGTITWHPTPGDLFDWLPRILGGGTEGTVLSIP